MLKKIVLSFVIISSCLISFKLKSKEVNQQETISDSVNLVFEDKMIQFLHDKGFSDAIVSIYKDGNKIVDECYGVCKSQNRVYPIASVSKLFTEAAIKQLVVQKKISNDTRVIDYLDLPYDALDERVKQITVEQLVNHTGGWDRDLTDDPLFSFDTLPQDINTKADLLKYILTTVQLDHHPGEVESYSNFGYFLLGRVIEKASGEQYLDYINKHLAEPNQIHLYQAKSTEAQEANSLLNYFKLELSTASFGLAANISDLSYYFTKVTRDGFAKTTDDLNQEDWWKDGSLPGSVTSLVKQRASNTVIAVFIPGRNEETWMEDNELLNDLIDQAAASVGL